MNCPICKTTLYKDGVTPIPNNSHYEFACKNKTCNILDYGLDGGEFYCHKDENNVIYYCIVFKINEVWYSLLSSSSPLDMTRLSLVDMSDPCGDIEPEILKINRFFKLDNYEEIDEYKVLFNRLMNLVVFS